tara:strand:- start:26424 stop:27677 length:1254 start_codon:yes stop_codon:yes gene_type:complete
MGDAVIQANKISKSYRLGEIDGKFAYDTVRDKVSSWLSRSADRRATNVRGEHIWALKNIDLEIKQGEKVGIIGRNGAGKSTLLKILSGITTPTSGEVRIRGRVSSLLEVGTGFHAELTGRENVFLNGAILGLSRAEIMARFDEIVDFSGVETFLDTPVKRYSSGMVVRLAFSVAAHLYPDVLLVDEVLAVGDAEFRKKCLGRMDEASQSGRTIVFVSHNMSTITQLCDRGIFLDGGKIVADDSMVSVVERYLASSIISGTEIDIPDFKDHDVQIKKIYLTDNQDQICTELNRQASFKMIVETHAWREAEGTINLALRSIDGTVICHTIAANNIGNYTQFSEGQRHRFSVEFPGEILNDGHYNFRAWVVPVGGVGSFHHAESYSFGLYDIDKTQPVVSRGKRHSSVIRPPITWTSKII